MSDEAAANEVRERDLVVRNRFDIFKIHISAIQI